MTSIPARPNKISMVGFRGVGPVAPFSFCQSLKSIAGGPPGRAAAEVAGGEAPPPGIPGGLWFNINPTGGEGVSDFAGGCWLVFPVVAAGWLANWTTAPQGSKNLKPLHPST